MAIFIANERIWAVDDCNDIRGIMNDAFIAKIEKDYSRPVAEKVEQHLGTNQTQSHLRIAVLVRVLEGEQPSQPSASEPFTSFPARLRFSLRKRKAL